jgi:hypothetical protein
MPGPKQVCVALSLYVLNQNGGSAYVEYRLVVYIYSKSIFFSKQSNESLNMWGQQAMD